MTVASAPVERVELWGEWFASRAAGQFVIRGVDNVLRIIEQSLQWSTQGPLCPSDSSNDANKSLSECSGDANGHAKTHNMVMVSRPLVWPLFLPLVGALGVVRVTVYVVSRVIRYPRDTSDMIRWLQSKRRYLRLVRYAGRKNMQLRNGRTPTATPQGTPCAKRTTADISTTPEHERKRKYDDVEQSDWTDNDNSDDENVVEKLERYEKDYDSENDSDFVPDSEEDSSEDEDSAPSDDEAEDGAVLVNGSDVPSAEAQLSPVPNKTISPAQSPKIETVESPESVSEYGSAGDQSPTSTGSGLTSPLSPKSKFVKFFRRGSKTKQQL